MPRSFEEQGLDTLRGLIARWDNASTQWPTISHRLLIFKSSVDFADYLERLYDLDATLSDDEWSSDSVCEASQLFARRFDPGVILGEFREGDSTRLSGRVQRGLMAFCELANHSFEVLGRAEEWAKSREPRIYQALYGDGIALPVHPWLQFLYEYALRFRTPSLLVDIAIDKIDGTQQRSCLVITDDGERRFIPDGEPIIEKISHSVEIEFRYPVEVNLDSVKSVIAPLFSDGRRPFQMVSELKLTRNIFVTSWEILRLALLAMETVSESVAERMDVDKSEHTSSKNVVPTADHVHIGWGVSSYSLQAAGKKLSLPDQYTLLFQLFVDRIKANVPAEVVEHYLLNLAADPIQNSTEEMPRTSATNTVRKTMLDLNRLLIEWTKPGDGQDWLQSVRSQGYKLNHSLKWSVASELREKSVQASYTDRIERTADLSARKARPPKPD